MTDEKPTLDEGASIEAVEPAENVETAIDDTAGSIFEDDTQQTEDAPEDDAAEESEEISFSIEDLAPVLGIDTDLLDVVDNKVVYKAKIDGVEKVVPLEEAIRSYQIQGHLDNKNREVTQLQEQLKAQAQQGQQATQATLARLQQLEDVTTLAWQELSQANQEIDWEYLRENDKGEYAALKADFQARSDAIQQRYNSIQQQREATTSEKRQEYVASQEHALVKAIPEWADVEVGRKAISELKTFVQTYGFDEAEANTLTDHRIILAMRDAKAYRDLQDSKPELTKAVKRTPKVSKPGSKQPSKPAKELSVAEIFYGEN